MRKFMKGLIFTVLVAAALMPVFAQKSYVKYDGNGRAVGLLNLKGDAENCKGRQTFAGTISKWSMDIEGATPETLDQYFFTVALPRRKSRNFYFGTEMDGDDVEKIIRKNNRVTVIASFCAGGVWQAAQVELGNKL